MQQIARREPIAEAAPLTDGTAVFGDLMNEDFTEEIPRGRVIGSTVGRLHRGGIDAESVIEVRDGALRIHPLAAPGWARAGISYGWFTRRNGLGFAVHVLNGDNGSAPYRLPSLPRRLARWILGSGTDPLPKRLLRFPFRLKREGTWRRIGRWNRACRPAQPPEDLDGNLAIGWFPEEVPEDPTRCGNGWIVRGAGPENGHLLSRVSGGLQPAIQRLANVPIHYVVVLREVGAAYYLASMDGVSGSAAFPFMRPVAIDATERHSHVYPGIHQSVVGEIGFGVESVLYGAKVADLPGMGYWYGSAHAADSLRGTALLSECSAEIGGRWMCLQGDFRQTSDGAVACAGDCLAVLNPPAPTGLIHARVGSVGDRGHIALVWRVLDDRNHWRLRLDGHGCHLDLVSQGAPARSWSDPAGALTPGCAKAVQICDDGTSIAVCIDGRRLSGLSVADRTHAAATGVGLASSGGSPDLFVTAFEAHPRLIEIPMQLRLAPSWPDAGTDIVLAEDFAGERDDLAGHESAGGFVWRKLMGRDRIALDGKGGARVVASAEQPVRRRLAYGVDWPDPHFADVTTQIVPPTSVEGTVQKGRGGLIFWQDDDNYIIVNTWLDDSHTGDFRNCSAVSSFFCLRGFEDIYDAVWTNLSDLIRRGEVCTLRILFDGDRYRVHVNGETVLYRALRDIYPGFEGLAIRRVGIVANWEWGHDTGSRFRSFTARRRRPIEE